MEQDRMSKSTWAAGRVPTVRRGRNRIRATLPAAAALALAALPAPALQPAPEGPELQVNVYTTGFQSAPSVAKDGNGNCVVVWQSPGRDGSGSAVMARLFDPDGVPRTGELQVNTFTTSDQQ